MTRTNLLALGIVALMSCTSSSDSDTCTTKQDCAAGQVCEKGVCVDDDGSGGSGGGGGECLVTLADPTCNTCVRDKCCATAEDCLLDVPECSQLLDCLSTNCADATDVDACMNEYCANFVEKGLEPANAYVACLDANCREECTDCPVVLDDPECNTCMGANCCDLAEPCFTEGEACNSLRVCLVDNCSTAADVNVCMQEYCSAFTTAGLPPFNAYVECLTSNCETECNGTDAAPESTPLSRPNGEAMRGTLSTHGTLSRRAAMQRSK